MLAWAAFEAWRYVYFGDLVSNTAYAQEIDVLARIRNWQHSFELVASGTHALMFKHGIYLLIILSPLALFLQPTRQTMLLGLLTVSMVLTTYLHPVIFGFARLDGSRTTTHLAVYTTLAAAILIFQPGRLKPVVCAIPLLAIVVAVAFQAKSLSPYPVCCGTQGFERIRAILAATAQQESIPRPTIANPDLGAISWHKQFNVVDLGRLGNPILATLNNEPLISEYFFEYAAPDLFESHAFWSCVYYDTIMTDPRFRARYQPVHERLGTAGNCPGKHLPVGIWIRKDMLRGARTAERRLVDDLAQRPSTQRITRELEKCDAGGSHDCIYVIRTAYRFLPEFRAQGVMGSLLALFEQQPRLRIYARYMLNGYQDATAYKAVIPVLSRSWQRDVRRH